MVCTPLKPLLPRRHRRASCARGRELHVVAGEPAVPVAGNSMLFHLRAGVSDLVNATGTIFRINDNWRPKRDLYEGQELQSELDMEQQTGSKKGKEYVKAVYCHPAYLTYMQSTSCETLGWMKHKLESRLWAEISITSNMQMTPPLWQKAKKS